MTREELIRFFEDVKSLYPNFDGGTSKFALETWLDALGDVSLFEAQDALKKYANSPSGRFIPKPYDIAKGFEPDESGGSGHAEYGCAFCSEHGIGDGMIRVAGSMGGAAAGTWIDCPCQLIARGVAKPVIDRLIGNINAAAKRGVFKREYREGESECGHVSEAAKWEALAVRERQAEKENPALYAQYKAKAAYFARQAKAVASGRITRDAFLARLDDVESKFGELLAAAGCPEGFLSLDGQETPY